MGYFNNNNRCKLIFIFTLQHFFNISFNKSLCSDALVRCYLLFSIYIMVI